MRTFTTGLGVLVLTGSLLVGCGGDDEAASALRDGEAPGEDGDAEGGTAALEGDGGEGDGGDEDPFCAEVEGIEERMAALQEDTSTGEQLDEMSATFEELAEDAPDEIAEDMDTLARALAELAEVFERVDFEDPESLEVLEEESARLEEEFGDLEAAGQNVETYLREECGIDIGADVDAPPGGGEDGGGQDDGTQDDGTQDDSAQDEEEGSG